MIVTPVIALKLLVELVGELEREPVLSESKAWLIEALWCAVFEKIPIMAGADG